MGSFILVEPSGILPLWLLPLGTDLLHASPVLSRFVRSKHAWVPLPFPCPSHASIGIYFAVDLPTAQAGILGRAKRETFLCDEGRILLLLNPLQLFAELRNRPWGPNSAPFPSGIGPFSSRERYLSHGVLGIRRIGEGRVAPRDKGVIGGSKHPYIVIRQGNLSNSDPNPGAHPSKRKTDQTDFKFKLSEAAVSVAGGNYTSALFIPFLPFR
ncbi:hypothetical protein DFH09DRAFT_1082875 [Mycena vulgaris]|nr:hypothetical protein DFH09DRAFT_1082875 [Mycena vulgaris]